MNKLIVFLLLILTPYTFQAQEQPQMADTMRQEGKIYVVVAVLSIVFICLATYLIMIDRKLKNLENKK